MPSPESTRSSNEPPTLAPAPAAVPARQWAARMAGSAALYAAAAALGLRLAFMDSVVSLFWLPTGVAVAALAVWGAPLIVPLLVAAFAVQFAIGLPWWGAAAVAAGAVAGPWVSSRLLAHRRFDPGLRSGRDFKSLALAALVGMLLPATGGIALRVLTDQIPPDRAMGAWIGWYAGDTLGVLLAAPPLLAAHAAWRDGTLFGSSAPVRDARSIATVAALLCGGLALAFATATPYEPQGLMSMFALQLALAAGAAWLGVVGIWATLMAVAVAVATQLALGVGPFVRARPDEAQWVAWLFLLIGWVFAVIVLGARRRLEATQSTLGHRDQTLRAMFEQSNAALSVSERGRYVMVNEAFATLVGRPRETLIGMGGADITHPDDRHLHADALRAWASGEPQVPYEKRYVHADGRVVWARVAMSVIGPSAGGAPQVLAVKLDITAHKRLEASLRRQREQLALVFEATGSGIFDHDLVEGRTYYSDSYLRMLGYPAGTRLDRALADPERVHPDDRGPVIAATRAMLERHRPFDLEYRLRCADGSHLWVHGRGFAVWDAEGRPVREYGAIADISARKAAEGALVDNRARLSAVIDSALDAIVSVDEAGRVVVFNAAAEALYGRPAADVLGEGMLTLVPPRLRGGARDALHAMAERSDRERRLHGRPRPRRIVGLHADGLEIPLDASVTMVGVASGRLFTGVLRDARERQRVEQAESARAQAEAASRSKSVFLSRMSHELRTPLNAVLGFAQLMELDADAPLPPAQRDRVHAIREAGTHLGALIDELLDLTRIESGRIRLDRTDLDVASIVDACLRLVSPLAEGAGVTLVPPRADEAVPTMLGDRMRLRQVLVNLLSNAIKYNRPGGTVEVRCGIGADGHGWIDVTDDGPGIAPEHRARLFEPFERLGRERGDIPGSGIGLALSRRLVGLMGGTLEVDGEFGRGSTFRVRLECAPIRPARPARPTAGAPPGPPASAAEPTVPGRA